MPKALGSSSLNPNSSGVARTFTLPYWTVGRVISISATLDLRVVLVALVPEELFAPLVEQVVLFVPGKGVPLFVGVAIVSEAHRLLAVAPHKGAARVEPDRVCLSHTRRSSPARLRRCTHSTPTRLLLLPSTSCRRACDTPPR